MGSIELFRAPVLRSTQTRLRTKTKTRFRYCVGEDAYAPSHKPVRRWCLSLGNETAH